MQTFFDWLRDHDLRPNTIKLYQRVVGDFVAWRMTDRKITDDSPATVSRIDLADYREALRHRGLKATTINPYLAALDAWLEWGVSTGQRHDNPATDLKRIKTTVSHESPVGLSRREVSLLLHEAAQTRHRIRDTALITLMVQTGLRMSEVCNLQWRDIQVGERSGMVQVRAGKGNKDRQIPLTVECRKTLWHYAQSFDANEGVGIQASRFDAVQATRFQQWIANHQQEHVFQSQKQTTLAPQTVWEMITTLAKRAGIQASPHTLRHTFGTELVRRGVGLSVVAHLMGHSSVTTTQRYTCPSADDLAAAVQLLDWE